MRCWVAFVVFVVAASTVVRGVILPYGGNNGADADTGRAGSAGSATTGSASSQRPTGSAAQAAGQSATGGAGGSFTGFGGGARTSGAGGAPFAGVSGGTTFSAGGAPFAGVNGDSAFPSFGGIGSQDGTPFPQDQSFVTRVIQQQATPTVTQTVTIDTFTTLTDIVFQSYGVTLTQFVVQTATRPLQQVVVTPVDDVVAISTTVVHRPEYITLSETKSDFRLAVRTSVTHVTLTHTSYAITHVPFTITATETVHLTSPVVKTIISTRRQVVTDYRTLVNTIYVHGGYY